MALTVAKLLARKADVLGLRLLTGESTADREITTDEVVSPGLVLAGFVERFTHTRSQVLGETELIQHFGLGADFELGVDVVHRVEVEWPASGSVQGFDAVPGGQTLLVVEGQ